MTLYIKLLIPSGPLMDADSAFFRSTAMLPVSFVLDNHKTFNLD